MGYDEMKCRSIFGVWAEDCCILDPGRLWYKGLRRQWGPIETYVRTRQRKKSSRESDTPSSGAALVWGAVDCRC